MALDKEELNRLIDNLVATENPLANPIALSVLVQLRNAQATNETLQATLDAAIRALGSAVDAVCRLIQDTDNSLVESYD